MSDSGTAIYSSYLRALMVSLGLHLEWLTIDGHVLSLIKYGISCSFGLIIFCFLSFLEAFSGDNVMEQFEKEKAEVVSASLPKTVDISLPGKCTALTDVLV